MADLPDFIESPHFPLLQGWEFDVEPDYRVDVVPRGTGYEQRNASSQYPKRRITVRVPADKFADIPVINRWHHAVRGKLIGFRVQDPTDFLSLELDGYDGVGVMTWEQCTALDQPLTASTAYPGSYQIIKRYRLEGDFTNLDQNLPVYKPYPGRIRVANDSGVEQDAETWDLDTEKGLVTPATGFIGTPLTWGGQFDLPMRFDSGLPIVVRDMLINEVTFVLYEIRPQFGA